MELQTVEIKVSKALRQYIIGATGSDCITPEKDSVLWGLLKQYLVSNKMGRSTFNKNRKFCIRISLRNIYSTKAYNRPSRKTMRLNVTCRASLTLTGERVIARMLEKEFKKSFVDYMKGCLNNSEMTIKDAIDKFCIDHSMDLTSNTYEMLKKHWYRWKKKNSGHCSVNY